MLSSYCIIYADTVFEILKEKTFLALLFDTSAINFIYSIESEK